jgi:hypothetical protein
MASIPENLFAQERAIYESKKPQLLAEHQGKFALIYGGEIAGVFDTDINALQAGYEKFGPVPLFIQQILPQIPDQSAPALSLGILTAAG